MKRKRRNRYIWMMVLVSAWFLCFPAAGAEQNTRDSVFGTEQGAGDSLSGEDQDSWEAAERDTFDIEAFTVDDFDAAGIQAFLDRLSGGETGRISFGDLMKKLVTGRLSEVFTDLADVIRSALFSEIRTNSSLMGQIIVLAFIGAVFSNFSGIFGSGQVSETGFYVVYLLIMTFLAASFFASVQVADSVLDDILEFMKVLLPAYFMAVAMAGGSFTSAGLCGFTFAAIGLVQTIFSGLLIPLMRVYMMMVLAGNLYKEDMISKMTELLKQFILWTVKTMVGLILGFHLIQGLVLPQADALKNASAMRALQMIPGIGSGAGAVSQIVMGSGILIKNTAGAAAVVVLLVMAAVPVIKLLILMLLYHVTAAVMQPVCDKRLVACISETAAGHGLLLKMVGYSLALFALTIAILCISTNAAYYAG